MEYLVLLSSIALGALTVFGLRLYDHRHVKLLNAFTGAYLLTLTMLVLLPELYHVPDSGDVGAAWRIGAFILLGFFAQIALDSISLGIEHGHVHHLEKHIPYGVVIGLCLHAFTEALALGDVGHHHDPESRRLLFLSIIVHKYPVSVVLLGMLLQGGIRKSTGLMVLGLFALMAPIGLFISTHTPLVNYSRELMAITLGIFMHISTTILFESSEVHRFNLKKLGMIVLGTALGVLSLFFHHG